MRPKQNKCLFSLCVCLCEKCVCFILEDEMWDTLGPSPRFESSLLVNVLLVSMPESRVVESWLFCRSESHRVQSFDSWPSKRTVFFRRSVYRRLSVLELNDTFGSSKLAPALRLPVRWLLTALAPCKLLQPTRVDCEPDINRVLFQYGSLALAGTVVVVGGSA